jgi:hypothetical protein
MVQAMEGDAAARSVVLRLRRLRQHLQSTIVTRHCHDRGSSPADLSEPGSEHSLPCLKALLQVVCELEKLSREDICKLYADGAKGCQYEDTLQAGQTLLMHSTLQMKRALANLLLNLEAKAVISEEIQQEIRAAAAAKSAVLSLQDSMTSTKTCYNRHFALEDTKLIEIQSALTGILQDIQTQNEDRMMRLRTLHVQTINLGWEGRGNPIVTVSAALRMWMQSVGPVPPQVPCAQYYCAANWKLVTLSFCGWLRRADHMKLHQQSELSYQLHKLIDRQR